MYSFEYHRPKSLDEALALLKGAEDARPLAGGHTLLPTMKQRLASPSDLIDLSGIAELKGIKVEGDSITVGAMTPHCDVTGSAEVRSKIPGLASLVETIGDPQVRHKGTLGGSIANNDPAADYPGAVLGLGATVITTSREITADEFFVGLFETALEEGELIKAVRFPVPEKSSYAKFAQPASRFSLVGVFVAKTGEGIRVAVTGAGNDGVFRVPEMESALAANFTPDAIADVKVSPDGMNADIHGSAEYRAHLVTVMAKRAVAACK